MIQKISTKELKPGMQIVNLDLPWLSNPFLYAIEGIIDNQEEIDRIISEGFLETYIDTKTDSGREGESLTEKIEREIPEIRREYKDEIPPTVPLEKELPAARSLYDDSVRFARNTILSLRSGEPLPLEQGGKIVDEILNSITRNYNALLGLIKLRSRDEYTYMHCINVCVLASLLAVQTGLDKESTKKIGIAGLFHDIGKASIPDAILNKTNKLTDKEFEVIKKHPELGVKYLNRTDLPEEIHSGILDHHEKINGTGYPRGLKGDEISQTARIISIVDVYDALTSRRVYKDPMLPHQALSLMYSMRGEEFDETILEHFIRSQGIYPVGSVVELSSGWRGVVVQINPERPLFPQVALVRTPLGKTLYGDTIDLAKQSQVKITKVMTPFEAGVEPSVAIPGSLILAGQQYSTS